MTATIFLSRDKKEFNIFFFKKRLSVFHNKPFEPKIKTFIIVNPLNKAYYKII